MEDPHLSVRLSPSRLVVLTHSELPKYSALQEISLTVPSLGSHVPPGGYLFVFKCQLKHDLLLLKL